MKNLNNLFVIILLALLSSCGISDRDKQEMEQHASFVAQNWDTFAETSLFDIHSGSMEFTDAKYIANFTTRIERDSIKVVLKGQMGFNKFNNVAFYKHNNETKLAIVIESATIDGHEIPVSELTEVMPDIRIGGSNESNSEDTAKRKQQKAVSELKSWGADDAYFDESGYLVYVVDINKLSDSPDNVAKSLYPMFEDTPGIKGIKIVSSNDRSTQLGIYTK